MKNYDPSADFSLLFLNFIIRTFAFESQKVPWEASLKSSHVGPPQILQDINLISEIFEKLRSPPAMPKVFKINKLKLGVLYTGI